MKKSTAAVMILFASMAIGTIGLYAPGEASALQALSNYADQPIAMTRLLMEVTGIMGALIAGLITI